jgi:HD-GYP domain-containing protein (c-di-GMP phosphodiesterase class II)
MPRRPSRKNKPKPKPEMQLRKSEIISSLSFALDLTEGQPLGHSVNSCLLGMRIAELIGIPQSDLADLYYAMLTKDLGCSSNAARMFEVFGGDDLQAKREVKTQDWSKVTFDGVNYLLRNVLPGRPPHERLMAIAQVALQRDKQARAFTEIRCERGAQIALRLGFSAKTSEAIRYLDEHWDGKGYPRGLKGDDIPLFSQVMNLAQTIEVFATLNGPDDAFKVARERCGTWFDPAMVNAIAPLERESDIWSSMEDGTAKEKVAKMQPGGDSRVVDDAEIDRICEAFAAVIDAKSPYTHDHSQRVTEFAVSIGTALGLGKDDLRILRRAGLLHDIGKLGVPNSILDKPGKLTAMEWETVRLHPYYTQRILERISGFEHLAFIASTHHEKLDGSGYYRNLRGSQLPTESRALVVADIFDALFSIRPYRAAMPVEKVLEIMGKDVPHALDAECFEVLKALAPKMASRAADGPIRKEVPQESESETSDLIIV